MKYEAMFQIKRENIAVHVLSWICHGIYEYDSTTPCHNLITQVLHSTAAQHVTTS